MYPGYQSLFEVARALGCSVDLWEPQAAPDGRLGSFEVQGLQVMSA
jgi:hypothetical protein